MKISKNELNRMILEAIEEVMDESGGDYWEGSIETPALDRFVAALAPLAKDPVLSPAIKAYSNAIESAKDQAKKDKLLKLDSMILSAAGGDESKAGMVAKSIAKNPETMVGWLNKSTANLLR